jgi:diaminopimelate epimerase
MRQAFGIGGDGLIYWKTTHIASNLETATDFKMVYYNSDGNQSSMCGNGGRCLVAFAKLQLIKNKTTFIATDGLHHATIGTDGLVALQMIDVNEVKSVLITFS